MKLWMLAAGLLFASAIVAGQTSRSTGSAPAGNAANGKKLFSSYGCYQCHGYEGQGGSAGRRLAPRPFALDAFIRYVRRPTNQMPPFTDRLVSDQDLRDIHAYLESIPAPPRIEDIPLLRN